jgi:uncharacterized protein (TIGR03435 family)
MAKGDFVDGRTAGRSLAGLLCFSSFIATALAQAQVPSLPVQKSIQLTKPLVFDVVSIRRSGEGEVAGIKILPDGYQARGMSLDNTILVAYFPAPYFKHEGELKGGPAWVYDDLYDIEAKISPADMAEWRGLSQNLMQTPATLQMMLQAVLSERLKLVMHRVSNQVDGYALTLNKRRLRIAREEGDHPSATSGMRLLDGGNALSTMKDGKPVWVFSHTSMAAFIGFLSFSADSPIVDRTGLQGKYHFDLDMVEPAPETSGNDGNAAVDPDRVVPLDIEAVGFKLDRIKVSASSWAIDRVERPSSN